MVSASVFWSQRHERLIYPDYTPLDELDVALDSAGFTAMALYKKRGPAAGIAGAYPWTLDQYLNTAIEMGSALSWYSQPDFCCEPEIAADAVERDWRIRATATMLEATLRTVATWQQQYMAQLSTLASASVLRELGLGEQNDVHHRMAMNFIRPPVPVLQGWTVDDYRQSIELLYDVWSRWEPLYECVLVGVGSVCRRDLHHPRHGILRILDTVDRELPKGVKLHLFGVKSAALRALRDHPRIASVDSMAYDFRARVTAREAGVSNTLDHRRAAMNEWMSKQASRLDDPQRPLPGVG